RVASDFPFSLSNCAVDHGTILEYAFQKRKFLFYDLGDGVDGEGEPGDAGGRLRPPGDGPVAVKAEPGRQPRSHPGRAAATAALLVATVPVWMVTVGGVAFRLRITVREVLGVVIGFGGIFLLVGGVGSGRSFNLAGMLAVLVAALCWGTGSVYSKRAALPKRALVSTAMQMLAGWTIELDV